MYSFVVLNFTRYLKQSGLERASGLSDLHQLTMAAASARSIQTVLHGRLGLMETDSLASVGAEAPSVQRFYKEELFWQSSSPLT